MADAIAAQSTSYTMKQQDSISKMEVKQPELDTSHGCTDDDVECIRRSRPPKIEPFSGNVLYPTSWLILMAVSFAAFCLLTFRRRAA